MRIAGAAPRRTPKLNVVTSERLYALGIELMDGAVHAAQTIGAVRARHAIRYRDGLIISTLAMIPLRRGAPGASEIGRQLVKMAERCGDWTYPPEIRRLGILFDYSIPQALSARIDLYLERLRSCIRGSDKHAGLWPSQHNIPMRPDLDKCRRIQTYKEGFRFWRQCASLPPCRRQLLVSVRPRKHSRHQGPSWARNICHDGEALHYDTVAGCRTRFGAND